jgi:hypothetical protein
MNMDRREELERRLMETAQELVALMGCSAAMVPGPMVNVYVGDPEAVCGLLGVTGGGAG